MTETIEKPRTRWLKNINNGRVFQYTSELAKKAGMVEVHQKDDGTFERSVGSVKVSDVPKPLERARFIVNPKTGQFWLWNSIMAKGHPEYIATDDPRTIKNLPNMDAVNQQMAVFDKRDQSAPPPADPVTDDNIPEPETGTFDSVDVELPPELGQMSKAELMAHGDTLGLTLSDRLNKGEMMFKIQAAMQAQADQKQAVAE